MSDHPEPLTAEQLAEQAFKDWDCPYVVEISSTSSMQRLRGINPELNKAEFRYTGRESAVELSWGDGVPRARTNYALMFRGEPLELNGNAVTAVNVKGRWGRPLGRRHLTMTAGQFASGSRCSCGNKGRALFSDGTTLCRKCLPGELDCRLTPAVRAARIIDSAKPSLGEDLLATDLVIYAAHQVVSQHGFLTPSDARNYSDKRSTKVLVEELCRSLLDGSTRPDPALMSQAPFLRHDTLQMALSSPDRDLNSTAPLLERDALTSSGAAQAIWAYARLLGHKALGRLTSLGRDPGHLGLPGARINLELWVDRIEDKTVYALTDNGHAVCLLNPAERPLESEERYRLAATVAEHTSREGLCLTRLSDPELLDEAIATA